MGQTRNKDGTPRRVGSGRTPGSTSIVLVSVKDINSILQPEALVPIHRKTAEQLGIPIAKGGKIKDLLNRIDGTTPATEIATNEVTYERVSLEDLK